MSWSRILTFMSGLLKGDGLSSYQKYFVVRYSTSVLLSVIVVRSSMAIEAVSVFELLLFFVSVVTTFWSNGIKNALLSRFTAEKKEKSEQALLLTTFLVLQLISLVTACLYIVVGDDMIRLVSGPVIPEGQIWLLLLIVFSVPSLLTENLLYLTQQFSRLDRYAYWSAAGQLLSVCIALLLSPTVSSLLCALAVWSCVKWVYAVRLLAWRANIAMMKDRVIPFIRYSTPLIFLMLLGGAMEMMDGILVSHYFSLSEFPVYRYGARELPFSALLFSSLGAALIPLIQNGQHDAAVIRQRVSRLMHILFPLSILAVWVSVPLFGWVYGKDFAFSGQIFSLYLGILSSRVLMPQVFQQAFHQHKVLVTASCIELVVNLVLSLWWMQWWGISGLVAATVVAYGVEKAILIFHNSYVNGISFRTYIPVRLYGIYTLVLLSSICVSLFVWG